MALPIYTIKHKEKFLRTPSLAVDEQLILHVDMQDFFRELKETLMNNAGAGLAAPQVGMHQRIICINREFSPGNSTLILINPRLVRMSKKKAVAEEGCLSIPGIFESVERAVKVRVKALTEENKKIDLKAKGWLARILQHEIDHLDGILFIDRLKK